MQVFMQWPDVEWSARHTDSVRLNKGVTEAYQLAKTSIGISRGHPNHPARTQFEDRVGALVDFAETTLRVYSERTGGGNVAAAKAVYSYARWRALVADPAPEALAEAEYLLAEVLGRGSDDTLDLGIHAGWAPRPEAEASWANHEMPWSFGDPPFHLSQQLNLCRKRGDLYGPLFGVQAWSTMAVGRSASDRVDLVHRWGRATDPLVDADSEPYLWPRLVDGERYYQVGTKSDRKRYAYLYDADPAPRTPLLVTPEEALARLERNHPRVLASYLDRVERFSTPEGRAAEFALEREYRVPLASRYAAYPVPLALPPSPTTPDTYLLA